MMDLTKIKIDYDLLLKFPPEFLIKNHFFPISKENNVIKIITNDPENLDKISMIENYAGCKIVSVKVEKDEIEKILKKGDIYQKIIKDKTSSFLQKKDIKEIDDKDALTIESITDEDDSIAKLLNNIIFSAVSRKSSDIHIEVSSKSVIVKFRIDGILNRFMEPLDISNHSSLITRLKVISDLDIAERRIPQDGRFRLTLNKKTIDFRVSIMPAVYGENAVIRILDREMITENLKELSLKALGFTDELVKKINYYIRQPYGMFLVTGPTGSGKTTTLYAALNEIKSSEDKIITIEDPVEYQIDDITQIPVNEKKGLTFAKGLRSILRHDPDKIMVGEIRDSETAQIAIQSALTGHLVFTTVHANNVFDVLGRFIHMGVDVYSFISSLNCIAAQRLVRKLCTRCKKEIVPSYEMFEYSRIEKEELGMKIFEPVGCQECLTTGYSGRIAIGEILELNDEIKEMILAQKPTSEIKKVAMASGMKTIRRNGIEKVKNGLTSIEELNRVTVKEWK